MKKLFLSLFVSLCCICSVCGQTRTVLYYEQLLDTACAYLEKNLIEEGESILIDLEGNEEAPERLRLNATLVLANLYVNLGEADRLQESLLILDDYLQQYPDRKDIAEAYQKYRQAYVSLELYGTPFEDRMCGLWVSTYNDNRYCSPIFALAIYQDSIGNYQAELNENCYFAKELSAQDNYEKHVTSDLTFLGDKHLLSVYFGDERLRKSRPELAAAGVAAAQQFTRSRSESISRRNKGNLNSVKNSAEHTINDLIGIGLQTYARSLAVEKKYVKMLEIMLREVVPGMMLTVDMAFDNHLERSDGKNSKEHETREINLYKVLPQDSILFISPSDWTLMPNIIACRKNWTSGFSDDEIIEMKNKTGKYSVRKRKLGYVRQFNRAAYARLYKNIQEDINRISEEFIDTNTKEKIKFDFEQSVLNRFEISDMIMRLPKLSYGNFTGIAESVFPVVTWFHPQKCAKLVVEKLRKKWYYMCGEYAYIPLYGKFTSERRDNKRVDYEGEWLKKRFHGFGTLTTAKGTYTGEFVKGKKQGKGRFVDTAGNVQEGIWKKDKLVETKKL